MSATVRVSAHELEVEINGLDKLWALKSRLTIPLENVRGATHDPGIVKGWPLWRAPGTFVPGLLKAGTFYQDGDRIFCDVHDANKAVVIELEDERYRRLVVEVDDPMETVAAIERALRPA